MVKRAKKNWDIDMRKSIVIGDQLSDIKMAKKSKLKYFLVDKNTNISQLIKKLFRCSKKLFNILPGDLKIGFYYLLLILFLLNFFKLLVFPQ